jgi:hypothetical protein
VRKPVSKKAATKAKAKPAQADRATVDANRAKAYRDMEPHVGDLAHAATLAMEVFDQSELFLFAVTQLEEMVQRFRQHYYAEKFKPE